MLERRAERGRKARQLDDAFGLVRRSGQNRDALQRIGERCARSEALAERQCFHEQAARLQA